MAPGGISNGGAQDVSNLGLHASRVPLGPRLQLLGDIVLEMPYNELRHAGLRS
jgi:hypothetical protein